MGQKHSIIYFCDNSTSYSVKMTNAFDGPIYFTKPLSKKNVSRVVMDLEKVRLKWEDFDKIVWKISINSVETGGRSILFYNTLNKWTFGLQDINHRTKLQIIDSLKSNRKYIVTVFPKMPPQIGITHQIDPPGGKHYRNF